MILKKLLLIMWEERFTSPLRIIKKSYARYKKHGLDGMLYRLDKEYFKLYPYNNQRIDQKLLYKQWIEKNEQNLLETEPLNYQPLVSIITPVFNTEIKFFSKMIESVLSQTYTNWELCIADDASTKQGILDTLKFYDEKYENIKIVYRKTNGHISEASNSALELASGEYVTFLDHDDLLAPNALYEMVKKLNENRSLKFIYSDEDKIDEHDNRFNPHFKSGWNPAMFYSQNYICHLVFIKKELVEQIGGFRKGYEGSQDYDLLLRITNILKETEIDRVEKILYHWRAVKGSAAYGTGEKSYAHQAGKKALKDFFSRKEEKVLIEDGLLDTTYKVVYSLPENSPLVSIIIPTRDGYDILFKCIESIFRFTKYANYEIIIVDNETTCPKTLEYFEKLKQNERITILEYHLPFNYSAINNFAVQHATGEVIALLNNDVEIISENWLIEMVSYAIREEIGAVGAKLYYSNDTIQHAGVIIGLGGVAGHSHKYFSKKNDGYYLRLKVIQNLSAVTAACLVVRKKLYEEVCGLNEPDLKVAFNDVDFCLKLLEHGYKNIWTPYSELYHHESISRGNDDNPEKAKRYLHEVKYMQNRWRTDIIEDQYYNRNLTREYENFGISER